MRPEIRAQDNRTTWSFGYVYAGSQVIAQYDSGTTRFIRQDNLALLSGLHAQRLVHFPHRHTADAPRPRGERISAKLPRRLDTLNGRATATCAVPCTRVKLRRMI